MIAVRIPKEIKDYKEKLLAGLTVRQLIAVLVALAVAVPLYVLGRGHINEEILSWGVIIIVFPCAGFGFFRYNGMNFEQFVSVIMKQAIINPMKRRFSNENFFESAQNEFDKMEMAKLTSKQKKKMRNDKRQAGLERTFLLYEAESEGRKLNSKDIEDLNSKLLTVNNRNKKDKNRKNEKAKMKEKMKTETRQVKSKLEIKAWAIKARMEEEPTYLPTKIERKILLNYANKIKQDRIKELTAGKKAVQKKNNNMQKRKTAKTSIPKSTQASIPYIADYEEGLFEIEPNRYSKTILIKDINYLVAKEEEQVVIFCKYGEFLNYFSEEMDVQITINNQVVSMRQREEQVYYKMAEDKYDKHRKEYNRILKRQLIAGNNDIQQMKYVTITISADSPFEAILKFHKIQAEVLANLQKFGSMGKVLTTDERLMLLHDYFRKGKEGDFKVNYDFLKEQGLSSKDYIAPSSFYFDKSYFMIDNQYHRVMFLNNLPSSLSDDFLNDLVDCEFPLMTTISIKPVAQDKGIRLIKKQLTGMEANKIEAEKKAMRSGYSPETISHDLKQSLVQAEELLDDMTQKNQRMFFVTITLMVHGNTKDELEENCIILINKARKFTCQLQNLNYQQEDAFKQTLPMGLNKLYVKRTLTTESTAIFMPFSSQELYEVGGFYYGLNQISRNLILLDRTNMKTPSGFILGSSGSGKSFATKREILNVLLHDNKTRILIIDPDNEYAGFARAFGGEVINISAESTNYINPLDMSLGYSEEGTDPLATKSEYIMSIIENMLSIGSGNSAKSTITPTQKTIIDRCLKLCYKEYLDSHFDESKVPTLLELQEEFDREKEISGTEDARQIAEGVEYYTKGSMNIFSHKSNVEYSNRLVVFNIQSLGNQLKAIALLIVMEFCWNSMLKGKSEGQRVYLYVDEIHSLFQNDFSARYLQQFYKRGRKYGLVVTGITQNMEDLLRSEMAKGMIGNSDFIMMLNQAPEDLKVLANMLNISEAQMSYVSMAQAGSGLLFAEKTIVPFIDQFPSDSYLYSLMSTKFGEEDNANKVEEIIQNILDAEKQDEEKKRRVIVKKTLDTQEDAKVS